jgi:hypothetical protein
MKTERWLIRADVNPADGGIDVHAEAAQAAQRPERSPTRWIRGRLLRTSDKRPCHRSANHGNEPAPRIPMDSGSTPNPMQSLCTLRSHCHHWLRNTRYQADATPYLGRTFTGCIAPACGWRTHSITSSARASSNGGMVRPSALAVLRLMISSNLLGCSIGRSAGFAPLKILSM